MVLILPFVITGKIAIPWVPILTETNQTSAFCVAVTVLISNFYGIGDATYKIALHQFYASKSCFIDF